MSSHEDRGATPRPSRDYDQSANPTYEIAAADNRDLDLASKLSVAWQHREFRCDNDHVPPNHTEHGPHSLLGGTTRQPRDPVGHCRPKFPHALQFRREKG